MASLFLPLLPPPTRIDTFPPSQHYYDSFTSMLQTPTNYLFDACLAPPPPPYHAPAMDAADDIPEFNECLDYLIGALA